MTRMQGRKRGFHSPPLKCICSHVIQHAALRNTDFYVCPRESRVRVLINKCVDGWVLISFSVWLENVYLPGPSHGSPQLMMIW